MHASRLPAYARVHDFTSTKLFVEYPTDFDAPELKEPDKLSRTIRLSHGESFKSSLYLIINADNQRLGSKYLSKTKVFQ